MALWSVGCTHTIPPAPPFRNRSNTDRPVVTYWVSDRIHTCLPCSILTHDEIPTVAPIGFPVTRDTGRKDGAPFDETNASLNQIQSIRLNRFDVIANDLGSLSIMNRRLLARPSSIQRFLRRRRLYSENHGVDEVPITSLDSVEISNDPLSFTGDGSPRVDVSRRLISLLYIDPVEEENTRPNAWKRGFIKPSIFHHSFSRPSLWAK